MGLCVRTTEQNMAWRTRAGSSWIEDPGPSHSVIRTSWLSNRIRKVLDLNRQLLAAPTCSEPDMPCMGTMLSFHAGILRHSKPLFGQALGKCLPHCISQSSPSTPTASPGLPPIVLTLTSHYGLPAHSSTSLLLNIPGS